LPWNTNPEKFGSDCCSPSWIFFAIANSSVQVVGGAEYPYFCSRSVR
jgi:hypothetical protein